MTAVFCDFKQTWKRRLAMADGVRMDSVEGGWNRWNGICCDEGWELISHPISVPFSGSAGHGFNPVAAPAPAEKAPLACEADRSLHDGFPDLRAGLVGLILLRIAFVPLTFFCVHLTTFNHCN